MAVDLHTHSRYSDGSDEPRQLVEKAARGRLTAVALTDHDTIAGLPEASLAASEAGIELIGGTEISCQWASGTMHIVVLFLESESGAIQDRLSDLRAGRDIRNREIVARLNELGIDITVDEVLAEAGRGSVGRPHIAAILVRKGVVADIRAGFDEYLGAGRPAYVERVRLEPPEAIKLALASEGVPILAHPHTLGHDTAEEFGHTFKWLADIGLVGLECYYGEYEPDRREDFAKMASQFGFLPSGGSDYHGTYKPDTQLGIGSGDLSIPDQVLVDLRAARDRILSR